MDQSPNVSQHPWIFPPPQESQAKADYPFSQNLVTKQKQIRSTHELIGNLANARKPISPACAMLLPRRNEPGVYAVPTTTDGHATFCDCSTLLRNLNTAGLPLQGWFHHIRVMFLCEDDEDITAKTAVPSMADFRIDSIQPREHSLGAARSSACWHESVPQ